MAIPDLLFGSRVHATAKEVGAQIASVRRGQEILARAREERPDLILVDLAAADLRPMEGIAALKADAELKGTPVVGFYAHTSGQLAEDAAKAGCDRILTKGEFSRRLAELLAGL